MSKSLVIVLLFVVLAAVGCVSDYPSAERSPVDIVLLDSRGYEDYNGWVHIVFSVRNNDTVSVEMLRVEISIYDESGHILNSKTLYPSPYTDYGLSPGQQFNQEVLFDPDASWGFDKYSIKVVSYDLA